MAAEIVSSTPQPIYPVIGKNLAPLDPLTQNGNPHYDKSSFVDAIKGKYANAKKQDYVPWQQSVDIGRMVANCRTGKLLLLRHPMDGSYMFTQRQGKWSDQKTVGGIFQFYCTKLLAEWLSARPEIDPIVPSDDDQIVALMDYVKIMQDYYSSRFFDDKFETAQCESAQDFGMWVTRFRFDPEKQDIVCELLPYPACRWDIRFTPEESPYFIYESKESTAVLKRLLKQDISEDDGFDDQYGLRIIEQIAKQGGNVQGSGKEQTVGGYNTVQGETVVTQMWLQPEAYADIELMADEGTICGIPLEKGADTLLKMFPDGMCVVGINQMNTIIGLYAENHKDHIVSGYYHIQSFSGIGKGVSDAVDTMKEINDLHSQVLSYIKAYGTPIYGYDSSLITEEQARNLAKRKNVAIDFTNARDGVQNINQVIQALIPGNPSNSSFAYGDSLNNMLQMAFQVTTFSDGMPGVNNETATGAQIGEANERMMLVPQHRNKADWLCRANKVIYNLFKGYIDKPRFYRSRSQNGITAGKYLSGSTFDGVDIDFEIVADSEIPRTRFTQEMSATKFLQFTGGLQGLIEASNVAPEMTARMAQIFGVKGLPIAAPKDIARICRQRLESARQAFDGAQQMMQMIQAATGQMMPQEMIVEEVLRQVRPPISPGEKYAEQKLSWFSELLDADELAFADPSFRDVVQKMMLAHVTQAAFGQALVQRAAVEGEQFAMAPMAEQAQQMQQAQAQQEQALQQQQDQASIDQTERQALAQSAGQIALRSADAEMKAEEQDRQFKQEITKTTIDHSQQMEMKEMELAAQAEKDALDRKSRAYPTGTTKKKKL